ncbi:MarR family transcriptional regulator [Nocardioides sp. ChNu-153]|uniref:MarR family winged helix-turn-helix transcriptional regulator n=1 Tax=Nocardioides sp. ChNu-153 TaxID=2779364 RepID=UPI002654C364|nr:MarR family transcriptional regulator [Nocardioides sp. ChNu-153]MDN7120407.1 MarR family transcriptional regulator [Nocardioides sp. ChNu-153]
MPPTTERVARTDAGLAAELRVAVMRLRRRLANERDPANDLGIGVMGVLGALHRHGEASVGELAAFEKVQPPSMTRAVRKLEERGYVARRSDERDGRLVLVSLTDAGRELVLADRRRRDEWLARELRALTPAERATLRAAVPILARLAVQD